MSHTRHSASHYHMTLRLKREWTSFSRTVMTCHSNYSDSVCSKDVNNGKQQQTAQTRLMKNVSEGNTLYSRKNIRYFNRRHNRITYFLACLLAYLLTPWSRFIQKLTGSQLVKKFIAFYGTRKFNYVITNARHLSLSWVRSIQSRPPHQTSWKSILILSSHLRLDLPNGLFPLMFPHQNPIYTPSPPHVLIPRPSHYFRIDHWNNIGRSTIITGLPS
jgi:hypothetical protein